MKRILLVSAGILLAAGFVLDAVSGLRFTRAAGVLLGFLEKPLEEKIYWCPMHPFYKVRRYGICPYCNMALEEYTPSAGTSEAEPVLILSDQQIQQGGVRTEKIRRRELVREIQTSGLLEKNHVKYWHVEARFEGWIEELFLHHEGQAVALGEPVARVYSPELYATQKEFLLVKDDPTLGPAARKRLELMGVDPREIRELEERGQPDARLTIRSRYDGTLVHLNVKAGMRIPEEGHIADIADLRELWLFADVYPGEIGLVSTGQEARIQADAYPGETFLGKVDLIEPSVRPETQTLRVRIRVPNDPVRLLPGQFARVLLLHRTPEILAVGEQAVIPTGRRDLVIVSRGGGRFAAREVSLGRRWLTEIRPSTDDRRLPFFTGHDRYHEVRSGLDEGEEVVTAGAFLLHAETQIRQLIDKMVPPEEEKPSARSAWSGLPLASPHWMDGLPFRDMEEHARYKSDPASSWKERFPRIEVAATSTFRSYLRLHRAWTEGKEEAATLAPTVASEAETVKREISPAIALEIAAALASFTDGIRTAAELFREASTPKDRAKAFGMLSSIFERYVEEFGPPIDGLRLFYCGMAQNTTGSPTERWFQDDDDLRNPYGMPGCGKLEKRLTR